jgi:hypothetical protein
MRGRVFSLASVDADLTILIRKAGSIAHQAASRGETARRVQRGYRVACRQRSFRLIRNASSTEKHEHPEGAVNPVTREGGASMDCPLLSDHCNLPASTFAIASSVFRSRSRRRSPPFRMTEADFLVLVVFELRATLLAINREILSTWRESLLGNPR